MQDKPQRSRTFAILAGLMLGLLAAGVVFLIILVSMMPDSSEIDFTMMVMHQNATLPHGLGGIETATASALIAAQMTPCAWSWASRNEVEFAADLQEKLAQQAALADTIAITVNAFSRGENCNTGQGTPRYGAMDTDISIAARLTTGIVVNDLETAYIVLEPMTRAILESLASYPHGTPSFQINLTVEFRASAIYGEGVYIFSADAQGYQAALEQSGTGIKFFEPLGGLYTTPVIRVT